MPETTIDICEGYEDAPFCEGPSLTECPSGIEVPETEECNSYGEDDGLIRQPLPVKNCEGAGWTPTSPFCEPSPSWEVDTPGNDTSALGEVPGSPDPVDIASCEEDGTCDDSCTPPARGDCLLENSEGVTLMPEPQIEELPATGPDQIVSLALVAAMALTAGVGVLRRTNRRK